MENLQLWRTEMVVRRLPEAQAFIFSRNIDVTVDKVEKERGGRADDNIQNKTTIRDAIRAGANCVKRGT